jgi:NAD(P)-dependent dehydrogenase (short-subunit alcohol dehydrogenase family)
LADAFIDRSFAVLAPNGRFLELGKRGIWTSEQVAAVRPAASYYPYDLADFLQTAPAQIHAVLQSVVDEIGAGRAHVLPLQAFPATAITDAFRYMAQARHIGKVVITHNAARASVVRADGRYLITGGLGGLGLAVARWLVAQGARHLALVGRRRPSAATLDTIGALEQAGVEVLVLQADIACEADVERVFATLRAAGPALRGVIHAAGVLDDGMLGQQTWERFTPVLAPKLAGAWLLDQATRTLPLDFFVLFSSSSALLGAAGQANYAAANAALDALAQRRRAAGLPALSVNWGAWDEVGMVAALDERDRRRFALRGIELITLEAGLRTLQRLLAQDAPQIAVLPISWPTLLAQFPAGSHPLLLAEVAASVGARPDGRQARRARPARRPGGGRAC